MPDVPISTSTALKRIRRERQERAIEDLLFAYPGLIHPDLSRARRQPRLGSDSRADLLFELGPRLVLVEIKRHLIRPTAVDQIERYARRLGVSLARISGYLVAPDIEAPALRRMEKASILLCFRKLGVDIPTKIKICARCRQPYGHRLSSCPYDGEIETI